MDIQVGRINVVGAGASVENQMWPISGCFVVWHGGVVGIPVEHRVRGEPNLEAVNDERCTQCRRSSIPSL